MLPIIPIISFVFNNWRLVLTGAGVAAALVWLGVEHHKVYVEGETAAIQKVEKRNAQELSTADAAQKLVDDCYAAGGTWNRSDGLCYRPSR